MENRIARELPPANPGLSIFRRFSWYLEEAGATEALLWPPAYPGARVFRRFSWYLDYEPPEASDSFLLLFRGLRPIEPDIV